RAAVSPPIPAPAMRTCNRLLALDGVDARAADHFILRPGASRAADRSGEFPGIDDRDAAARADDVVQGQQIGVPALDAGLERLGLAAELRRRARLVLGDGDRADLRIVHAGEGDQVAAPV